MSTLSFSTKYASLVAEIVIFWDVDVALAKILFLRAWAPPWIWVIFFWDSDSMTLMLDLISFALYSFVLVLPYCLVTWVPINESSLFCESCTLMIWMFWHSAKTSFNLTLIASLILSPDNFLSFQKAVESKSPTTLRVTESI